MRMWKGAPVMEAAPMLAPQSTAEAIWPVQPNITLQPPAGQPLRVNLKPTSRLLLPVANPVCSTLLSLREEDCVPVQLEPADTKAAEPPSTQTVMSRSAAPVVEAVPAISRLPELGT